MEKKGIFKLYVNFDRTTWNEKQNLIFHSLYPTLSDSIAALPEIHKSFKEKPFYELFVIEVQNDGILLNLLHLKCCPSPNYPEYGYSTAEINIA